MLRLEEFAVGEVADEVEVGGEEVVGRGGWRRGPEHVLEDAVDELAAELADEEELDFDGAAVAVGVADGGDAVADGGGDAELFVELAGEGLFGGFAGFDLAAGELPLEAHGLVGRRWQMKISRVSGLRRAGSARLRRGAEAWRLERIAWSSSLRMGSFTSL